MSTNAQIRIVVNGEARALEPGQTVLELLTGLAIDPARVAVELDRCIVKPREWASTRLADGARLEIVQFVGGG
ncbi:MAG TPA: sulfur carrier protein ThiS [Bryobacteraceae bacterium]|nr:sulfur carrier protein ThiS [Bryobacteraceae bacterium]